MLSVNICDKKNNCSGKEIDYEEWFADKYLTTIVNEKHFDINASEEDNRIKDVSKIHHIPIPNQIKSTYQYKIRTGTFDVDSSVASVSQDPQNFFDVQYKGQFLKTKSNDEWFRVTFEMSKDVLEVRQQVYFFLDFLKDMGGLLFFLYILVRGIVCIMTWN